MAKENELELEYKYFKENSGERDYNNYFTKEKIEDFEVFNLIDLLYHLECYLMLSKFINRYWEVLILP